MTEDGGRRRPRAQTAVLGLVLLVGLVAITSIGILAYAGQVTTDLEQQVENERVEGSFVELSRTMTSAASSRDVAHATNLDVGERGAVVKTDTGHVNITGTALEEPINVSLGTVEYEGDDGTRIAYQAGGVFRETGQETRIVAAPPIHYDDNTLSFPIVQVADEARLGSGDVSLSHVDTTAHRDAVQVEDSVIEIAVTSEYCVGWENYFERQTEDAAIGERCDENEDGRVIVELGVVDLEDAFEHGIYAVGGGGIDIECRNNEIVAGPVAVEGDLTEEIEDCLEDPDEARSIEPGNRLAAIDRVVEAKNETVAEAVPTEPDVEEFRKGSTLVGGKTYYADDDVVVEEQGDDVVADLENGNVTLVVDGDLVIDRGANANLEVRNYESGDGSFDVYVTGNLTIEGKATTDDFDHDDPNAKHLRIYGTSSMLVGIDGGGAAFEGTILAPRAEAALDDSTPNDAHPGDDDDCLLADGTYADVCIGSQAGGGNPEVGGSIVAGPVLVDAQQGQITLRWDDDLEDVGPDLPTDDVVLPPDLTYFNVAEHELDVTG